MDPTVAKVHFIGVSPSLAPSGTTSEASPSPPPSPSMSSDSSSEEKLARPERVADFRHAARTVSSTYEKVSSGTESPPFWITKVSSISSSSSLV